MHCHLHSGDWSFHLTTEKKRKKTGKLTSKGYKQKLISFFFFFFLFFFFAIVCFSLLRYKLCSSGFWGRNSSVGSAWARCPQRRGFDPPLGTFSGRGDFSLEVNMGSNSIPPKTLSDESINRGLVCAHMHSIAGTQKILTFMS